MSRDLAIDFGTFRTRVYDKARGLVYDEPSVAAVDTRSREVVALGAEADELVGRSADHVVAVRPLNQGAITDFDMAERMLRAVLARCGSSRMNRPKLLLTVPSAATSIERRALEQAAKAAGASSANLLESPLAAAIGLDIPIHDAVGSVIVDAGAGTTETAVISLGGVVASRALRIGGLDLDRAIASMVRHELDLVVNAHVAEELKKRIASVAPDAEPVAVEVHGRRPMTGEPGHVNIEGALVNRGVRDLVQQMIAGTISCLSETPPELAQDAIFGGIFLHGGGAQLHGYAELLSGATSVSVNSDTEPSTVVIRGAGRCLEDIGRLRSLFSSAHR